MEPCKHNLSTPIHVLQLPDVPYDSDGLLTISDPVQETLCSLIKAHREEVASLRKELCMTRRRLIRRYSEGPATSFTNAAGTSTGRRHERPSSCASGGSGIKAHCCKSSATNAVSVASSWENVDESDVNVGGMCSAPIDSLATMNCQRYVALD